ncbi:hypothetical protein [Methylobacterium nigriterrae]|uniref:hypothetical protein n=1 Tax=Methylobacterium nigriterrae TaxID=3127512 RepID=UPI003013A990
MNAHTASQTPSADYLPLSIRAYAEPIGGRARPSSGDARRLTTSPSEWTLVFDTETTTDAAQELRFGAYQVRQGEELHEAGIIYNEDTAILPLDQRTILEAYAREHGHRFLTRAAFIDEVFFGIGYDLRATIVGHNLPFDISRLAVRHGIARGSMYGGFSFTLSEHKFRPALQVKHLTQRISLIRFAAPFRARQARSQRGRSERAPVRRGFFVDTNTLAAALFSRSFSLAALSTFLAVPHPKLETDEHGGPLTPEYVAYAARDVQATWECFVELRQRYHAIGLSETPVHRIYSEASLGKAYLKAMGVKPWRQAQPNVPADLLAKILASYFGGRSEVRIRREVREVELVDFLSMYPTVCTLMGLWRFVTAKGMRWRAGTAEVRELLDRIGVADLQHPTTWRNLLALVRIKPDGDVLPVRAHYNGSAQATIGLNHLTSDEPLWFTLADCIASKLQTGRAPVVTEALIFEPGDPQPGLHPVLIGGDTNFRVDPYEHDFYRRLIEMRQGVKAELKGASGAQRDVLDVRQQQIKIAANATSYGIFIEVNVHKLARPKLACVHSTAREPFEIKTDKLEEAGRYYHPLLATLITGAARLMLSTLERLVTYEGLEWAFCDTDSMAIARPTAGAARESKAAFHASVDRIVAWFEALNPYAFRGSILKVEGVNFAPSGKTREPLLCLAVSAKRYALFNRDADGKPVLRKASAHGLGHLRAPYDVAEPSPAIPAPSFPLSELGVEHWQHDLWWQIASAALSGHPEQVNLAYHPALRGPAVSRYAATGPDILAWFKRYNATRPYAAQVRPFGFLLSLFGRGSLATEAVNQGPQRKRKSVAPKPVSSFDRDHARAAAQAFDRNTGQGVPGACLSSYAQLLAQYHLHPEDKFQNADYSDQGRTKQRHVAAAGVRLIGKEADDLERRVCLGLNDEAEVAYEVPPECNRDLSENLTRAKARVGERRLAEILGIARETLRRLIASKLCPASDRVWRHVSAALPRFWAEHDREQERRAKLMLLAREEAGRSGLSNLAARVGCDPSNLAKVLDEHRTPSRTLCAALARLPVGEERF